MSEPSKVEEKKRKKEEREDHRPREREKEEERRRRKKKEGEERRATPCSASGSMKKLKKVHRKIFKNFIGPKLLFHPE